MNTENNTVTGTVSSARSAMGPRIFATLDIDGVIIQLTAFSEEELREKVREARG